jgi:hypothetical protein
MEDEDDDSSVAEERAVPPVPPLPASDKPNGIHSN